MATGLARGAASRGKRIAFGDGRKIIWDQHSKMIFRGNPNVCPPGYEKASNLEWIPFYRGHRIYNAHGPGRWEWNMAFRPIPGEVYLTKPEKIFGTACGGGFIVIEPNVPAFKTVAPNKQWPVDRYDAVSRHMRKQGFKVVQFVHGSGHRVEGATLVKTPTFRHALAMLQHASLYIGPEGGLHHGAAAMKVPAVVLFGGFIPPQVTGYDTHTNLTGNATEACGSLTPCPHCKAAMESITVDDVVEAAANHVKAAAA